jgi:dethiobiotin synthetase
MGRGIFITGTDTGVGKTLVSTALLKIFAASGKNVIGMKPVAAGALLRNAVPYWEDVEALLAASNVTAPLAAVNPYALNAPLAPHIAAQREGIVIALGRIAAAYGELTRVADVVVLEGAGGFKVPLNERIDMSAIPVALGLPVILVVGLRLGCLNHALLTQDAITAAGLRFAGWVGNVIDPNMAAQEENIDCLRRRLSAPCLGVVPFLVHPTADHAADRLSASVLGDIFVAT